MDHSIPESPHLNLVEKRRIQRKRLIRAGQIIFANMALDVVLLDLSVIGVRVFIGHIDVLPAEVEIVLPDGSIEPALTRWQSNDQAGFEFFHPIDLRVVLTPQQVAEPPAPAQPRDDGRLPPAARIAAGLPPAR